MWRVGARFAQRFDPGACATLAELERAIAQIWLDVDWGWTSIERCRRRPGDPALLRTAEGCARRRCRRLVAGVPGGAYLTLVPYACSSSRGPAGQPEYADSIPPDALNSGLGVDEVLPVVCRRSARRTALHPCVRSRCHESIRTICPSCSSASAAGRETYKEISARRRRGASARSAGPPLSR
ncbi:cellulose biosynthesis protein BcsD [Cupriavidus basilensis]